jgi:N-acetylmuramoyl-L-alanine amidase CwlA
VYNVRGQDKTAAKKSASSKKTPSKPTTSKPASTIVNTKSISSSVEDLLRAAASELGLGRAIEILQGERARVRAVLGG